MIGADRGARVVARLGACGLLLATAAGWPGALQAQRALYHHAHVLTQDTLRPQAAWFVVENGRFAEVGSSDEPLPPADERIDLNGATVLPGFVDAHIHFVDAALSSGRFDLGEATDTTRLRVLLRGLLSTGADRITVGRNVAPTALEGLADPRAWLDRVGDGRAVLLVLKSGHAAVASTRALSLLGIGPRTRFKDGTVGRGADGALNGWLLEEAAMKALERTGSLLTDRTLVPAILDEQERLLRCGITSIGDNTFAPYHLRIYQALQREGALKLRIRARSYGRIPETDALMNGMGLRKMGFIGPRNDLERVSYHAIKHFEDMSLSQPPSAHGHGEPGGQVFLSEAQVRDAFLLHPRSTFAFHVQGKPGARNILGAWSDARRKVPPHRHILDHAGYIGQDELRQAHDLGLAVTIIAPQTFDLDRLLKDYRGMPGGLSTADLLDARAKFRIAHGALTSDLPYGMDTVFKSYPKVDGLDPFSNMAAHVSGRYPDGSRIPGTEGKTLTSAEAIAAYTRNGAFVIGTERMGGTIATGKWADFIVLDRDPTAVVPMDLYALTPTRTYIAGELVHDAAAARTVGPVRAAERIRPYDYNVSPVFGYDPIVGFIAGGAFFRYPLRTPGHYFDAQAMFSMQGQVGLQGSYQWFGMGRSIDGRLALGYTNMLQFYFGEGDRTQADRYVQLYAQRITARPELVWRIKPRMRATLLGDHRTWSEQEAKDAEGAPLALKIIPSERTTALGAEWSWDTRDAVAAAHRGVLLKVGASYVPKGFTSLPDAGDLLQVHGEARAFRYLGSAKWVMAARLRTGWSVGASTYLFRYTLGGGDLLRGYYSNRFRGDDYVAGQLELRRALAARWTLVGFLDAGSIGDDGLGRLLTSAGGGVRFAIKEQVVLRLDMGFGSDQQGLFFTFGHTF